MHECMTGHRTARVGLIQLGEPAAQQPGVPVRKYFCKIILHKSPCRPAAGRSGPGRPAAGRPGYIPVNFENENIFL